MKDLLSDFEKNKFSDELITFLDEEFDLDVGIIGANNLIDFIMKNLGNDLYNKGISDSNALMSSKIEEISFNLEELKR